MKTQFKPFLLAALLTLPILSFAQRFEAEDGGLIEMTYVGADQNFGSNTIDIINLTNPPEPLSFRWVLLENTFPDEWDYSMCDLGSCFPVLPDSNDMNNTLVGEDAFIICHAFFNGVPGAGTMKFSVYEIGDPANADTLTFTYTAISVGINNIGNAKNVLVYPNPVSNGMLNIVADNEEDVEIVNCIGQSVMSEKISKSNNVIDVNFLPTGVYFVKITKEDHTIKTQKLIIN